MNKMDPKNSNKPEDILNGGNSTYLEYLQNMYIKDPKSVDQSWSSFFESNDFPAEKASFSVHKSCPTCSVVAFMLQYHYGGLLESI